MHKGWFLTMARQAKRRARLPPKPHKHGCQLKNLVWLNRCFPPIAPPNCPTHLAQELNDPTGEIANVTPERRASGQSQQIGAGETYVGSWAPSRAACASTEVPPLAISAQRASSFGGLAGGCEFGQVRREDDGWRTRAQCFADGKRWTANVHLRATGSTLMWSSERGRATYYRCS